MEKNSRSRRIRWGVLGTGYAAACIVEALRSVPDAEVSAVASRSESRAREFAQQRDVPCAYGGYKRLVRDEDIDIVYIATPNSFHYEHTMLCLRAGKSVLCEKPFALTAEEAEEMARTARSSGLFCMEAMWTRFLPLMCEVRQIVRSGGIGDLRMLNVAIGHPIRKQPAGSLFSAELGGGSLLDLGVYGISLACDLLGRPTTVTASATIGDTGVDEQSSVILTYPDGAMATITQSLRTLGPNHAVLMGSTGRLRIHEHVISPMQCSLNSFVEETLEANPQVSLLSRIKSSAAVRRFAVPLRSWLGERSLVRPFHGNGKSYVAEEAVRCLREGSLESKVMPLAASVEVLRIIDEARQQIGLRSSGKSLAI